jgi:redox-sensitive bicupin YhaK (pirin superfamily)
MMCHRISQVGAALFARMSDTRVSCLQDAGNKWTLPATSAGISRTLYFFKGSSLVVGGQRLTGHTCVQLVSDVDVELEAGADETECLLLQGRPIAEPVAQQGPFVMNTQAELRQGDVCSLYLPP